MKRLSLRVVEGLARRRHGNRLKRDFNAQVPIPARTGNGFGEDEKSVRPLFSSRWEGVFYCPGKWRGRGAPRFSRKFRTRSSASRRSDSYGKKRWFHEGAQ